jgi:putative ubiquitin-RnfH superfamily antitoxin RatB of RatAB toxin-antitoxin module
VGAAGPAAGLLDVEVVFCPAPGQVDTVRLQLPPGSTLADALQASGLPQRHGLAAEALEAGIWSRAKPLATPLRDRDRVELYRPLQVDPKEARRLRYRGQRSGARPRA